LYFLCPHNHFWEWRALDDGRAAYDALVACLDPAVELDIYWATTAKRELATLIRELGARVTRLHLKDGPADKFESPMLALGDGVVDLTSAMAAATHADWMLVELDQCAGEMKEAVRRSGDSALIALCLRPLGGDYLFEAEKLLTSSGERQRAVGR
jgi:sugar phosphate isomerase/epimerase